MAKLLSGRTVATFTKIAISSKAYADNELENLTGLSDIKQSAPAQAKPNNGATVSVEAAIDNTGLTAGYSIRTVGLFATDPEGGEILYSVTTAKTEGYMPADSGISKSGLTIRIYTEVSNAANVNMEVDPAATATKADIKELTDVVIDLQSFVGYNDEDIYGVEVNMTNKTFKRLAGATNRTPGTGFDNIQAFGGRRRCNLTDEGKVAAYHGDAAYTETGALLVDIKSVPEEGEEAEVLFAKGTKVQVMVEQPKFYYRVVPLELSPIEDGKGHHLKKGRYYVSDKPKSGFKVHPAFIDKNGKEREFIYLSAFEGSLYDKSAEAYILDDAQVADFNADILSSISGAKPASGVTQDLKRANVRKLAQARGAGWEQQNAATVSATQLLFLVEYNSFNTQAALGDGVVVKTDDDTTSMAEPTGATTNLGNQSGNANNLNDIQFVTYRGEENTYGNIWGFVDGINVLAKGIHSIAVATHDFADNTAEGSYRDAGFTVCKTNGYVSAFGYNPEFDWLFIPSECTGNSSVPVGDYFYQNYKATDSDGWRGAYLGGRWADSSLAGGFFWTLNHWSGYRDRSIGGRLVYAA